MRGFSLQKALPSSCVCHLTLQVDVSPDPNHTILIKVALQCFDQDRFELRWAQLLFKDPHNDSLVFTEVAAARIKRAEGCARVVRGRNTRCTAGN